MNQKNGVKKVKVKKQQKPISQATAQALLHLIKQEISMTESSINIVNEMISDYWELSNPQDPESHKYFKQLNHSKTSKRLLAKRVKYLANISKQLKDYCHAS